jgi:hypothetical protein
MNIFLASAYRVNISDYYHEARRKKNTCIVSYYMRLLSNILITILFTCLSKYLKKKFLPVIDGKQQRPLT